MCQNLEYFLLLLLVSCLAIFSSSFLLKTCSAVLESSKFYVLSNAGYTAIRNASLPDFSALLYANFAFATVYISHFIHFHQSIIWHHAIPLNYILFRLHPVVLPSRFQ